MVNQKQTSQGVAALSQYAARKKKKLVYYMIQTLYNFAYQFPKFNKKKLTGIIDNRAK